jgi:ferredoxin
VLELVGLDDEGERIAVDPDGDEEEEYEKKVMTIAQAALCIGCTACSKICPKKCYTHAAAPALSPDMGARPRCACRCRSPLERRARTREDEVERCQRAAAGPRRPGRRQRRRMRCHGRHMWRWPAWATTTCGRTCSSARALSCRH